MDNKELMEGKLSKDESWQKDYVETRRRYNRDMFWSGRIVSRCCFTIRSSYE